MLTQNGELGTLNDYIISLDQLTINDVEKVGGKNASLGEMIGNLSNLGVSVPTGFATIASALDWKVAELCQAA